MQNLQNLISQLESKISQFETINLAISGGSVGWHIEHSLKTIDQIVTQNQESNAILRQKNNLKLYYENNLQKTKSKP